MIRRPPRSTLFPYTTLFRSDGYTLGTADSGTLAFNPAMYARLSYDAGKDFSYIGGLGRMPLVLAVHPSFPDRKSTRLNSSHLVISYAVFCLKKKKKYRHHPP